MTHRMRRDCNHECSECDLGHPMTCLEFALMSADDPNTVSFCRDCSVKAWHADIVYRDGDGSIISESHAFQCPLCHRKWVDGAQS